MFSLLKSLRWRHGVAPTAALAGVVVTALLTVAEPPPALAQPQAQAQTPDRDELVRAARDAYARKDRARVSALKTALTDLRHPLAPWADYWDLTLRLSDVQADEVDAFYARWPGSYVEDRLRNDWLLEVGHRRDWAAVLRELPRFKMNDDREVSCYGVVARQLSAPSPEVADAGRKLWRQQRDPGEGCLLMGRTLLDAKVLSDDDIWRQIRLAVELGRVRSAKSMGELLGDPVPRLLGEALDNPARHLAIKASALSHQRAEITALAVGRIATQAADNAAQLLDDRWAGVLVGEHAAWAWAMVAKQATLDLRPQAWDWTRKAWEALPKRVARQPDWSAETLGWLTRGTLRLAPEAERWSAVQRGIEAMDDATRADPTWQYWLARALAATAKPGEPGDAARGRSRQMLAALAGQMNFYGQLAAEDLGQRQPLPAAAAPLTPPEHEAVRARAGLQRALLAIQAGLRAEGVKEWNFSLIGMSERELLAAAQWACEREVWDRCINTSDRTRTEVELSQRFPMPMKGDVLARAREVNLDPAYVYGLIRQESRFIIDTRSHAGASGLMQVMPATARWTARKIGMSDFKTDMIYERDTNLRLGTAYLKLVLDDMGGSQALAAAAYNAGPNRPRRWRDGPMLEPAIWVENIPINETRDYVKKVLSNATYYAGVLAGQPASLKARLGDSIGPRAASAVPVDTDLP